MGVDFGYSGSTWNTPIAGMYAINATNEGLYTLDPATGTASFVVTLDRPFGLVGIEWHTYTGELYACTDAGGNPLVAIDPVTGATKLISNLPFTCNNLAAPWTDVPCVDNPP